MNIFPIPVCWSLATQEVWEECLNQLDSRTLSAHKYTITKMTKQQTQESSFQLWAITECLQYSKQFNVFKCPNVEKKKKNTVWQMFQNKK